MATSFGEQLRLAREARGISLREISEQTRISMRYLEAIEADDYKRLPGGIFNRSFIKAYARQIGFDEKEAIEAYTRTAREKGEVPDDVVSTPYQPRVYTDPGSTRSPFVTLLLSILILAILSLSVYAALHWYQRRSAGRTNGGAAAPAVPTTTQTVNPVSTPASSPMAAPAGLDIQVKALDKVWLRAYVDNAVKAAFEGSLELDQTKEFKPERRLRIQLSKIKVNALDVTINGRTAKVPADMKGNLAEMDITKDDYAKFLQ